jgi:predicted outer membrane repeat protein/parallel beta-helix repeat protein
MDRRRIVNPVVVSLGVAALACATRADTLYVDDDGPVGGDGQSWSTCCRFLQDALLLAAALPVTEIRVAQGTYVPDRDEATPGGSGDRGATFDLTGLDGVSIMGGFAGMGAPDPNARDIDSYPTVLSGDLLGNDLPGVGNDENSYRVVSAWNLDDTTVLDGFTITGGNNDQPYPAWQGAGMYNYAGSPAIVNCVFMANTATEGAGLYSVGNPTVTDCSFYGNYADYWAAGMMSAGGSPTLTNCSFSGNFALDAPAMISAYGGLTMTGCSFTGHISEDPQEAGGPLWITSSSGSVTVAGCTFSDNSCDSWGGAGIVLEGGSPTVIDCTFSGNSGSSGGGMHIKSGSPSVTNCLFEGNSATDIGGLQGEGAGIYSEIGSLTLTGCTFRGNTASVSGGGIYVEAGTTTVIGSTFCENSPDHFFGCVQLDGDARLSTLCPAPDCPGDLDGDGVVDVTDFLALLANWGVCP